MIMKTFIVLIFSIISLNFYAQQKLLKNQKPIKGKYDKLKVALPIKKAWCILNLGEIKKNKKNLYYRQIDSVTFKVLNCKTTIYSKCTENGSNTQNTYDCLYSEGEFLKGKYNGIWKYYYNGDKQKNTKEEKWKKGILIYSKITKLKPEKITFNDYDEEKWVCDSCRILNKKFYAGYKSISEVRNEYSLKNGLLMNSKGIVNNLKIFFQNISTYEFITILKGIIINHEIQIDGAPIPTTTSVSYDELGNIKEYFRNDSKFIKGTGSLKLFYTPIWDDKLRKCQERGIESEGEIKNNYKIGYWKYFNVKGKVIKTINYKLEDSVDVRFPNNIFYKN